MYTHVWLFMTLWIIDHKVLLSMRFSRQEYWNELPCPPPRDLPDPGITPLSLMSPALADRLFSTEPLGKAQGLILTTEQSRYYRQVQIRKLRLRDAEMYSVQRVLRCTQYRVLWSWSWFSSSTLLSRGSFPTDDGASLGNICISRGTQVPSHKLESWRTLAPAPELRRQNICRPSKYYHWGLFEGVLFFYCALKKKHIT